MKQVMHQACLLVERITRLQKTFPFDQQCWSRICGDMPIALFHLQKFCLSTSRTVESISDDAALRSARSTSIYERK
jgi:hypothetical protein